MAHKHAQSIELDFPEAALAAAAAAAAAHMPEYK